MPSKLAIGVGLAQGLDNASKNFLASMNAVQNMKQRREKFNLDKKKSNIEMDILKLDLDPEVHAQQKKKRDLQLKSAENVLELSEFNLDKAHNKNKNEVEGFKNLLEFKSTLDAETQARVGITGGSLSLKPEKLSDPTSAEFAQFVKSMLDPFGDVLPGQEENLKKAQDLYEKSILGNSKGAAAGTDTGEIDYDSLSEDEIFKLAQEGDENAFRLGSAKFGK